MKNTRPSLGHSIPLCSDSAAAHFDFSRTHRAKHARLPSPTVLFSRIHGGAIRPKRSRVGVTLTLGSESATLERFPIGLQQLLFFITQSSISMEAVDVMVLVESIALSDDDDDDDDDPNGKSPKGALVSPYLLSTYARHIIRNDHLVPYDCVKSLSSHLDRNADQYAAGVNLAEKEFILKYLHGAQFKGWPMPLVQSDASGKLRQSVSVNLRRAIARITKLAPGIGAYLRKHITLGSRIGYNGVRFEPLLGSGIVVPVQRKAAA